MEFLTSLAADFEIIVFTAAEQNYADEILNRLLEQIELGGRTGIISHRLYRQHTVQIKQSANGPTRRFIKDLSVLEGRNLAKTIIVDNIGENFCRQPRNGIEIATWTGNDQMGDASDMAASSSFDVELRYLQRLLLNMVQSRPKDLRLKLDLLKQTGLLLPQSH